MPSKKSSLLKDLSTADLKRLLAARKQIDVLEVEKSRLMKQVAKVEMELGKLMNDDVGGVAGVTRSRGKKAVKKTSKKATRKPSKKVAGKAAKKSVRKKAVRKKVVRKKVVRKKVVRKKVARKKVARKKTVTRKAPKKKSTAGKTTGAGRMKLEDVIVAVIRKNGSSIAFQDLKARIFKGKLFKTKSGNFDNVLRRTLSTSRKVKRVGRGIYDVA